MAPNLAVHRHLLCWQVVSDIALELWCDITFRKSNVHIANILLKLQNPTHLPESEVLFLVNFQYE